MRTLPFILLIVVSTAGFLSVGVSCNKKKKYCKGSSTCRSVLEAKEWFLFKQGSWWVYEEESSHQRDSQYVYSYYNSSSYDFDMRVHSTLADYDYHYWPGYASGAKECSESEPISGKCIWINRNKGKIGDYIGEGMCFFITYEIGDYKYVSNASYLNNKIIIENIYNSYSVYNNTYLNVIKIHELNTLIEGKQSTNHYYSKNIGLIRKELIDSNQVWNLVNYHIEK